MSDTKPYRVLTTESNTPEWLRLRKSGVGASESAAILGQSAWGTARTVYDQKVADEVIDSTTDMMEFGHLAEPLIVAFMEKHPERFGWIGEIIPAEGLLQSIEWPWLLGTLDREVVTPSGELVPLELKSVNDFVAAEWQGIEGHAEHSNNQRSDLVVPPKYLVQVQQQCAIKRAAYGYVAVWLGKGRVELIRVDADPQFVERYLVGEVGDFWNYNVLARVPPAPTINDNLWDIWPGDDDLEPVAADTDLIDIIGQWRIATTDARDLKKEIAALKFTITDAMGDATAVKDPATDEIIHTLKPQNTARGTEFDLLQTKYPDVYDEVIRPAGRTRVHRATKVKL